MAFRQTSNFDLSERIWVTSINNGLSKNLAKNSLINEQNFITTATYISKVYSLRDKPL